MTTNDEVRLSLAAAHRHEWARVLAATVRVAGDIDLAQECAQDAYVSALETWRRDGIPRNPGAWLTTTARRKALDSHRRATALRNKLPLLIEPAGTSRSQPYGDGSPSPETQLTEMDEIPDDRLRLVFICCHPALAREAQVALTLRTVAGLSTPQIDRAFLVSEEAMARRLTRAKSKIRAARIPFHPPNIDTLAERVGAVCEVISSIFTEGHASATETALVGWDLTSLTCSDANSTVDLAAATATIIGTISIRIAAARTTPFCASFTLGDAMARWVIA